MKKIILAFAFAILIVFVSFSGTYAGGWAVVTLDQLPTQVIANQPLTIGFVVRQHGRTPLNGLSPKITATRGFLEGSFTATAVQQGDVGHYVATLKFPSTGAWNWSINAFGMDQPMPILNVLSSANVPNPTTMNAKVSGSFPMPLVFVLLGIVVGLGSLAIWVRAKQPWAVAPALLAAIMFGFGLASTTNQNAAPATPIRPATLEQVETGKSLFIAKGCVVCHQRLAIGDGRNTFQSLTVGPNLTNLKMDPGYLEKWLWDPPALKPTTEMPRLGLSEEEIGALVAFLLNSP